MHAKVPCPPHHSIQKTKNQKKNRLHKNWKKSFYIFNHNSKIGHDSVATQELKNWFWDWLAFFKCQSETCKKCIRSCKKPCLTVSILYVVPFLRRLAGTMIAHLRTSSPTGENRTCSITRIKHSLIGFKGDSGFHVQRSVSTYFKCVNLGWGQMHVFMLTELYYCAPTGWGVLAFFYGWSLKSLLNLLTHRKWKLCLPICSCPKSIKRHEMFLVSFWIGCSQVYTRNPSSWQTRRRMVFLKKCNWIVLWSLCNNISKSGNLVGSCFLYILTTGNNFCLLGE